MSMPMMNPQTHERPPFMPTSGPPGLVHQHPPNSSGVPFSHMPGISHIPSQMPIHEHFNRPG